MELNQLKYYRMGIKGLLEVIFDFQGDKKILFQLA